MASLTKTNSESDWSTVSKGRGSTVSKGRNKNESYKKGSYKNESYKKGSYKKGSYKKGSYKKTMNWREGTTHFVPKGVKMYVDSLFDKSIGSRDFMKELKKEIKTSSRIWESTLVYVIHEAACRDKLEVIEIILDKLSNRSKIVNSKCGPKEFTPIFKSAYKGSIRALKMLLCAGADLSIKNKMGETVMEALEEGNNNTNIRSPQFKIFTDSRYSECRDFLTNWNPNKEREVKAEYETYVPPSMRDEEKPKDNFKELDSDIMNLDESDFLTEYSNSNDIKMYIENTEVPLETLVSLTINSAERNEECFNRFIGDISNLDDYVGLLINDDSLIDYVKYDAPYTKKEINKLRASMLFDKV